MNNYCRRLFRLISQGPYTTLIANGFTSQLQAYCFDITVNYYYDTTKIVFRKYIKSKPWQSLCKLHLKVLMLSKKVKINKCLYLQERRKNRVTATANNKIKVIPIAVRIQPNIGCFFLSETSKIKQLYYLIFKIVFKLEQNFHFFPFTIITKISF